MIIQTIAADVGDIVPEAKLSGRLGKGYKENL